MSSRSPTMRSRNINPNSSRRHMARSTPDEICADFDMMSDRYQYDTSKWLDRFVDRMRIKHKIDNPNIIVYIDSDIARSIDKVHVSAKMEPRELRREYDGRLTVYRD